MEALINEDFVSGKEGVFARTAREATQDDTIQTVFVSLRVLTRCSVQAPRRYLALSVFASEATRSRKKKTGLLRCFTPRDNSSEIATVSQRREKLSQGTKRPLIKSVFSYPKIMQN